MTPRQSLRYLLWYGEKALAGDEPTAEEFAMFKEAREASLDMAHRLMRLKPKDYEYVKGEPYPGE